MCAIQESFEANGFYLPIGVMSEPEARTHRRRLEEIEAEHGDMHYRVKPYLIVRSAFEIATHPTLLDAVEAVLGHDILLWDSSYIIKEPRSSGFVSWHQDLTYWGLEMDSDYDVVSVWVALSPATRESGCMQFVRGSHRRGRFNHEDTYNRRNILHRGQEITDQFDAEQIAFGELRPGQASMHQGWTVHASKPNTSPDRRVGIVMNYAKPSVRQVVGASESATLVRGRDNFGHFNTEPECVADFEPANVVFQLEMQRRKRDVYDSA